MNPQIIRIIDQYLTGQLPAADQIAFEERLSHDRELQREVNLHRRIMETSKRAAQRQLVEQAGKRYHFRKKLINSTVVVAIIAALTIASVVVVKNTRKEAAKKSGSATEALQQKLDDELFFPDLGVDRKLIRASDTVIFMSDGTLLSVPEDAFLLNGKTFRGEKIIQYQVARNASEIMKSGLSTVSDGKLLETGGMFSLNGYTADGRKLQLNPKIGVYVEFPVNGPVEGMQLFEGKTNGKEMVNWVNPKPLERKPVPASMAELDFYPPGYAEKLNELKWKKGKAQRDSLYLSFEEVVDSTEVVQATGTAASVTNIASSQPPIAVGQLNSSPANFTAFERYKAGSGLFNKYCATCHQAYKEGTGPALIKVRQKWAQGGAMPGSIYEWVQNWEKAAARDPYAMNVTRKRPTAMNKFPQLTQAEADMIFDFVDAQSQPGKMPHSDQKNHIPPSKVLAFWNPKFDNTILATRDFEKRMTAIHKTCDRKVLDLYLGNLENELWTTDAKVAGMGYPEFAVFAAERVGKIDLTDEHQQNLKQFFGMKLKEIREKAKSDKAFARKLQNAYDKKLRGIRNDQSLRDAQRWIQNYGDEWELNYVDCLRQLGKERPKAGVLIRYGAPVYNLDRFVSNQTRSRTSGKFYDSETGKTAQINYDPFSLQVADAGSYQKLFVYLLPDKLHSFERLPVVAGKVSYNLNRLMTYQAVVIGINENGYYLKQLGVISAGDRGSIALGKISERELDDVLNGLDVNRVDKQAFGLAEIDWLRAEQQNFTVQRLRTEQAKFRITLLPLVYPCMGNLTGVAFEPEAVDTGI